MFEMHEDFGHSEEIVGYDTAINSSPIRARTPERLRKRSRGSFDNMVCHSFVSLQ